MKDGNGVGVIVGRFQVANLTDVSILRAYRTKKGLNNDEVLQSNWR